MNTQVKSTMYCNYKMTAMSILYCFKSPLLQELIELYENYFCERLSQTNKHSDTK